MKNLLFFLTVTLFPFCLTGQITAKLYTSFYYAPSKFTAGSFQKTGTLGFEAMHVGISWQMKSGNRQELSLSGRKKSIDFSSGVDEYQEIGLRYEYNFVIKGRPNQKLHLYIGGATGLFLGRLDKISKSINSYNIYYNIREIDIHAIPRLTYKISKRLIIDVNVPIPLLNFGYNRVTVDNPVLTIAQRTANTFDFRFFEQVFAFRVGVGYTI